MIYIHNTPVTKCSVSSFKKQEKVTQITHLTFIPISLPGRSTTWYGTRLISSWTMGSENFLPRKGVKPHIVFLKFVTAWFLADVPINLCFCVMATIVLYKIKYIFLKFLIVSTILIASFSLRILSVTVFVVNYLHTAMAGNGDVTALVADVEPNYRHFLTKHNTLLLGQEMVLLQRWNTSSRRFPSSCF